MHPRAEMMSAPKHKLLIFELRMLGDSVLAIPFVRSAKKKYEVYVCCTSQSSHLFELVLPRDHILEWTPPWHAEYGKYRFSVWRNSRTLSLIRKIRGFRFAVVVSSWADARIHALMRFSGIRKRIGFPMTTCNYLASDRPWRRKQLLAGRSASSVLAVLSLAPLLTRPLHRHNYSQHHLEDWRQIADELQIRWDLTAPWIKVDSPITKTTFADVRKIARHRSPDKGLWVIHPGARLPSKTWNIADFQNLIDEVFTPKNIPVLVIDVPESEPLQLRSSLQTKVRTPHLRDLVWVVQQCDSVLCNDSVTSHLGSALGKKVVAIFGSGNPDWFAPYGNEDLVVQAGACKSHPCMDRCVMDSHICLDSITPDMVRTKVSKLL
ncbi:MAG: glycosyltransferase family 9 protein [Kiritimatiellia bacterium]